MPPTPRPNHGFTLLELLVVVVVIAMLLAIFLPALSTATAAGHSTVCATQQNQLFHGSHAYSEDHADRLPYYAWMDGRPEGIEWWMTQVARGMDQFEPQIHHCPADPVPQTHIQVYLDHGLASMADRQPPTNARIMTVKLSYRGPCDMVEQIVRTDNGVVLTERRSRRTTSWSRPDRAIELVEGIADSNERECFRYSFLYAMAGAGSSSGPSRSVQERYGHYESWERHMGTTNVLFLDGHLARPTPAELGARAMEQEIEDD